MVDKEQDEANEIALLIRKEKDWLIRKIGLKDYQNHLRHRIRRKLEIFWRMEPLLLLTKQASIVTANNSNRSMTTGSHDSSPYLQQSSLVKIPPQTWRKSNEIESNQTCEETKTDKTNTKWAGRDSNTRPTPCQVLHQCGIPQECPDF
ncbi:MAG TPA: hypothetical protein VIP70_04445 [Nitrososphaeraceae archaeon]